jgi:uncharacterized protein YdiU (UPF0061 family)
MSPQRVFPGFPWEISFARFTVHLGEHVACLLIQSAQASPSAFKFDLLGAAPGPFPRVQPGMLDLQRSFRQLEIS